MMGFIWVAFLLFCVVFSIEGLNLNKETPEQKMINECEQSLPRDQHCKLMAVPDKGDK